MPETYWPDLVIDLTGATLIDFDFADCHAATADFAQAKFIGTAEFTRARFSGDAKFDGARFTGNVSFRAAEFGGRTIFAGAALPSVRRGERATQQPWIDVENVHFEGAVPREIEQFMSRSETGTQSDEA